MPGSPNLKSGRQPGSWSLAYCRAAAPALSPKGGETIMRDWMEQHHPRLIGLWDWPGYRLFGRCWAQGCGRRPIILHTPRQLYRCERTPMAIGLTARGWLRAEGLDPAEIDAWCRANGVDPGAVVEPVPPANVA